MKRSNWLETMARVAVILMMPLLACLGYYAMAGGGSVIVGVSRVAGLALGLVSLLGLATAVRSPKGAGKSVVFWGVSALLALLLIGTSF
ncbi:MAG: hypothetical protein EP334_00390 [Gammaproteobacteria bacterium]|nr:MAG: hypothetical protein EP334_00390 [Gammaproteobacteria bacterium]